MLRNYFIIATRRLLRNKNFSFINIGGLMIGMTSATLILLWVQNEVSHDRFHKNLGRLYEVWSNDNVNGTIRSLRNTPEIMAPALKKDYPEVEEVTRLRWTRNLLAANEDQKLLSTGAVVDPGFLSMFSFPLVKGNKRTAFKDPHGLVITEKLGKKLFDDADPMGKLVRMGNSQNYTVTGVLKDLPNNTQFDFIEYLASYELETLQGNIDKDWSDISISTFVLLKPNTTAETLNAKLKNIIPGHTNGAQKTQEFLYPVSQLWLYSQFDNGKVTGGRISLVRTFIIIAIFILLIACINFMNLSTARSEQRAKEVGIRKVVGARRESLMFQFLCESILIALVAGVFAIGITELCLPAFNTLINKQLVIDFRNIDFWLAAVAFILITGILAGSYPAFFLSTFKPYLVLKGTFKKIGALVTPRKILVVLQFTFAIVLIICTMIVAQQVKYAQSRKSGYDRDHLVHIYMNDEMGNHFSIIKNELINSGAATAVSAVQAPLTQNWSSGLQLKWEGKDPNAVIQINRYTEEGDLVKTAGMQLIAGRDIDVKNYPTDSTACLINEAALKIMNFKNPIGQVIYDEPERWHVVGVIKDFIQESPYQPIKPMIIRGPKEWTSVMLIRLNRANTSTTNLSIAHGIFKKYNPAYPFEYTFTDEEYAAKFADEKLIKKLVVLFSWLTIFISCLGLFGLATYVADSKTKEIGVRKVLGATVVNITSMLSVEFVKLVATAILIASPIAWWAMHNWLKDFDYRIKIQWWVFAAAGIVCVLIAVLTVSFQAVRAAIANPVKSLRTE